MYLNFFPQESYSSQLLIKDLRDQPKNNKKQQCKLKNQSIINEFKKLITRPCHWVQISKKLDGGLVLFQGNLSSFKKLAFSLQGNLSTYLLIQKRKVEIIELRYCHHQNKGSTGNLEGIFWLNFQKGLWRSRNIPLLCLTSHGSTSRADFQLHSSPLSIVL